MPANDLLTLPDTKLHCRVDHDDDDTEITALIGAATSYFDGYAGILGRCLINQVWSQSFFRFGTVLRLPFSDVSSVVVRYFDESGVEQTLANGFELMEDGLSSTLYFKDEKSLPAIDRDKAKAITVKFTAGYGDNSDDVPDAIKIATKMLVAHWYEPQSLETSEAMNRIGRIIAPFRRVHV